jgi:hypothetical protein
VGKNLSDLLDKSIFLLEAFWYKLEEDPPFQIRYTVADKEKTKTRKETVTVHLKRTKSEIQTLAECCLTEHRPCNNVQFPKIRASLYFMKNIFIF